MPCALRAGPFVGTRLDAVYRANLVRVIMVTVASAKQDAQRVARIGLKEADGQCDSRSSLFYDEQTCRLRSHNLPFMD